MTVQRYSIREALNRIYRVFNGSSINNDTPESLSGDVYSENEVLSRMAELIQGSLPGETFILPAGTEATPSAHIHTQAIPIYDDSIFKVTGTSISFGGNIDVSVTGTVAFVSSSAGDIGCRVYHNTTQNVSGSVTVMLAFNSETYDTDTMHDNSVNNSRITINTAGKYLVEFHGIFNSAIGPAANAGAWIEHQSRGRIVQSPIIGISGVSSNPSINLSTIIDLAQNDYLVVKVLQDGAATETLVAGGGSNEYSQYFAAQKIN